MGESAHKANSGEENSPARRSYQQAIPAPCPFHPNPPTPCYRSGTLKTPVILPNCRWQVIPRHAYTLDLTKTEWADYAAIRA